MSDRRIADVLLDVFPGAPQPRVADVLLDVFPGAPQPRIADVLLDVLETPHYVPPGPPGPTGARFRGWGISI